jgi:hypothetical protein
MQSRLGNSYEVINMGVGGQGTRGGFSLLKHSGLAYTPEIVMLGMFIGNDIIDNNRELDVENNVTAFGGPEKPAPFFIKMRYMARKSYVYKFLSQRFYAFLTQVGMRDYYGGKMQYDYMFVKNYSPEVKKGLAYTRDDLHELKKLCDANKITLLAILIPIKDQVIDKHWNKFSAYHNLYDRDKPQRILGNMLRELKIGYLDLLPILSQSKNKDTFYYEIDPHCTKYGYLFIGERLADYITHWKLTSLE